MRFIKYIFVFWLLFDLGSLFLLAHFTDGGIVLLELLGSLVLGSVLLSRNKMSGLQQDPQLMMQNMMDPQAFIKKIKFSIAGIMLIIPGLMTDLIALLILSPLSTALMQKFNPMAQMSNMMGGQGGFDASMFTQPNATEKKPQSGSGQIIDGEYRRED